jgi:putative inorganic carbon (hco3(-)) transporter
MIHLGLENDVPLALYILMCGTFFLSVFWRPNLGVYFLVLSLPMQTARYKLLDLPLGSHFLDILLLGSIIGLVAQQKWTIPKTNIGGYLLLFTAFTYLLLWKGSFFLHAPLPLSIVDERFSAWKNYVEMFLFAFIVARSITGKKQVTILIVLMAIAVLLVNRSYYSTISDRDLSHFSYEVRDAGLLGYAGVNGLAAFEVMSATFLLGLYGFTKKWLAKIAILSLVATCCYCLLFSFSRGGYIAFLAGIITVSLFKSRWLLIVAAIIIISWQTLLPISVQERILMTTGDAAEGQEFDSSAQERIELWQDAMNLFQSNPVLGAGFQTYGYMGRVGDFRDTHNYFLKVLAETGLVGLALYLLLLWKLLRAGMNLYLGTDDPFWRGVALGFVAMLVTVIVADFFGDRWTYQQVDGYLWVSLGCVIRGTIEIGQYRDPIEQQSDRIAPLEDADELVPA